jgi:hypothetical protein
MLLFLLISLSSFFVFRKDMSAARVLDSNGVVMSFPTQMALIPGVRQRDKNVRLQKK